MLRSENPVYWSFRCGHWKGVPFRVSWLFPAALVPLCYHFGLIEGLVYGFAFLAVAAIHEAVSIAVLSPSRQRDPQAIVLWPLGNLAARASEVPTGKGFAESLSGLMILGVGCIFGLTLMSSEGQTDWGGIFRRLPKLTGSNVVNEAGLLILAVNLKLLLIQLVPIRSTDMGRFLEYFLQTSWDEQDRREISLKIGLLAAFLLAIFASMAQIWWLLAAAAVLVTLTVSELLKPIEMLLGHNEETFLGYDFSSGYTSLESSSAEVLRDPPRPMGLFERWLAKKATENQKRQEDEERQIESELDRILTKVHDLGVQSLNHREKDLLNRASQRFRRRGKAGST